MATMTITGTRTQTQAQARTAADMLEQYVQDDQAGRLTQDQKVQRLSAMVLRSIEEGERANIVRNFALERIRRLEEELTAQKVAIVIAGAALGGLVGGGIGLGVGAMATGATATTIVTSTVIGAGTGVLVGTAAGTGVNCYRTNSRHAANLEHLRRSVQGGVQ